MTSLQSYSAAGSWPDGTFGGGIAENGSIRPAHTRRRKPRDLIIVTCGGRALPDRNLAGDRASPFIQDHGGLSPRCEASARANPSSRLARARHNFQPADEPFEILVKPVPRFAHTTAPISRRNGHSRQAPSAASTGSRSSLVFVENKHGARPWVIASSRRGQS